jgi:hypothetical protein
MSSLRKVALAAAFTITMGGIGLSPAKAATETWNFNSPTGILGTTQTYLSSPGGLTATAAGFASTAADPNGAATPTALFGKNDGIESGSLENGLGVAAPPGGSDNEIVAGMSFVTVHLPTSVTNVMASLGSLTGGEVGEVFGSTTGLAGSWVLVAANITGPAQQGVLVPLQTGFQGGVACPTCTFFAFFAVGSSGGGPGGASDLLLSQMTANVSEIPIPGALPLFATGLVGLGLLGWRRKKRTVTA